MDTTEKTKLAEKEKIISQEFLDFLEDANRFKKSHIDLKAAINWLFAIAAAALLWMLNSFDKFKIGNTFPFKPLYITVIFTIGISVVFLGIARILLLMYEWSIRSVIQEIEYFPSKVKLFYDSEEEISAKRKELFEEASKVFLDADNFVPLSFKLTCITLIIFLVGLALLTTYVILFLLKCI